MASAGEHEPVLAIQMCGRLIGGVNVMGGDLIVTDSRLVFLPLIKKSSLRLSSRAAKVGQDLHDWDFSPQKVLNAIVMPLTTPVEIRMDQIQTISATRRCALRVCWSDPVKQRKSEFAVFASRLSTIWNSANVSSRDQLLTLINAVLSGD